MSYNTTEPNAVIFRLPDDEDGTKMFIQISLVDGKLDTVGTPFSVAAEDDDYNQMAFDTLVLAESFEGGAIDLARFQIILENTPVQVYEQVGNLQEMLPSLIYQYYSTPGLQ